MAMSKVMRRSSTLPIYCRSKGWGVVTLTAAEIMCQYGEQSPGGRDALALMIELGAVATDPRMLSSHLFFVRSTSIFFRAGTCLAWNYSRDNIIFCMSLRARLRRTGTSAL
jgi:hypothetical protein